MSSIVADAAFLIDLLALNGQSDVVGIYDGSSFQQLFADARPLKATVRETSKIMEHPAETGVIVADHHIINPVEIDIPLMIQAQYYASTHQQIKATYLNATSLSVQTRTDVYSNMVIADMPHDESPEFYDAITLAVHLKQVLYVSSVGGVSSPNSPTAYAPADPTNSNTAQNGLQSPVNPVNQGRASGSFDNGATGAW
jgi:hypothetical protein